MRTLVSTSFGWASVLWAALIPAVAQSDASNVRLQAKGNAIHAARQLDIGAAEKAAATGCEIEAEQRKETFLIDKKLTLEEAREVTRQHISCLTEMRFAMISQATGQSPSPKAAMAVSVSREAFQTEFSQLSQEDKDKSEQITFLDLKWGLGLGVSLSEDDVVDDAEIVAGIVRAKSSQKEQPRLLLEYHKFFWCNDGGTNGNQGCGPFVAVAATDKKVLSGVGFGVMYGRRLAGQSEGFSVGVGGMLDANVKGLADGFEENQPPPAGETVPRYKTESRWSGVLFVSRTFSL